MASIYHNKADKVGTFDIRQLNATLNIELQTLITKRQSIEKQMMEGKYTEETLRLLSIVNHKIEVAENRIAGKWEGGEASQNNQIISIPKYNQR